MVFSCVPRRKLYCDGSLPTSPPFWSGPSGASFQKAEECGYIVSCPALPGCHSHGDDVEVALKNIKGAIVGCLESLAEE